MPSRSNLSAFFQSPVKNKISHASLASEKTSGGVQRVADYFAGKVVAFKQSAESELRLAVMLNHPDAANAVFISCSLRKRVASTTGEVELFGYAGQPQDWTLNLIKAVFVDDSFASKHWGKGLAGFVGFGLLSQLPGRRSSPFHERAQAKLNEAYSQDFSDPQILTGDIWWTRGITKPYGGKDHVAVIFLDEKNQNTPIPVDDRLARLFSAVKQVFIVTESSRCQTTCVHDFVTQLNERAVSFPYSITVDEIAGLSQLYSGSLSRRNYSSPDEYLTSFFEEISAQFGASAKYCGSGLSRFNFEIEKDWLSDTGSLYFKPEHKIEVEFVTKPIYLSLSSSSKIQICCCKADSSYAQLKQETERAYKDSHEYNITKVGLTVFVYTKSAGLNNFYLSCDGREQGFNTLTELAQALVTRIDQAIKLVTDERILSAAELLVAKEKKERKEQARRDAEYCTALLGERKRVLNSFSSVPTEQLSRSNLDALDSYAQAWESRYGTAQCPVSIPQKACCSAVAAGSALSDCACVDGLCSIVRQLNEQDISKPFISFCGDIAAKLTSFNPHQLGSGAIIVMSVSQLQIHGSWFAAHAQALMSGNISLFVVNDTSAELTQVQIAENLQIHADHLECGSFGIPNEVYKRNFNEQFGSCLVYLCVCSSFPSSLCLFQLDGIALEIKYTKQSLTLSTLSKEALEDWITVCGNRSVYTKNPYQAVEKPEIRGPLRRSWLSAGWYGRQCMSTDRDSVIKSIVDGFVPQETKALRVFKELGSLVDGAGFNRRIDQALHERCDTQDYRFTRGDETSPYWHLVAPDSFPWISGRLNKVEHRSTECMYEFLLRFTHTQPNQVCKVFVVNLSDFGSMASFDPTALEFTSGATWLSVLNVRLKKDQLYDVLIKNLSYYQAGYHCYVVHDGDSESSEYAGVMDKLDKLFGAGEWKLVQGSDEECARQIFGDWSEKFRGAVEKCSKK